MDDELGRSAASGADFALDRFVRAQNKDDTYDRALDELRRGRKASHWMWFIFPQVAGLGHSDLSRFYAIHSREEAVAYLAHRTLGPRLSECATALLRTTTSDATQILGTVDALKLRSSMTLFRAIGPTRPEFQAVLDRFFDGIGDDATEALL